ncbi:cadherin-like beta sandwich domain-containing protein, partial [Cohnella xylanilytica]|uniref:cadherin-like beta sandwich domain-containing protein n=1 Tax=Cohnella xylanilytica TaxID=557555 RepID=UPI001BB35408
PNGLGQTVLVYPSQQIYLPGTLPPAADLNGQVGIVDVGSLIGAAPPEVIQALVTHLSAIKEEQEEQKKKLQENPGAIASGLETLGQIAENIDSLLPSLIKEAVDQYKLEQWAAENAVQRTKNETGYTIGLDKTIGLDLEQQKRQEELKQQQAREAREAQQKQQDQQAELQRELGEQIKQLQEQMRQIQEANRRAQQAAQEAAEAELKKKLSDAEKAKFEQNKQQNEQGAGTATPAPSTSSGSSKSSNANLQSLDLSAGTLTPAFDAKTTSYSASVASEVFAVDVIPVAASNKATLTVNGSALTGGKASVPLAPGTTTAISVKVKAEDGSIKEYKIAVARAATPPSGTATLQSLTLSAGTLSPGFAPETTAYKASVPSATGSVTVKAAATDSNAAVRVNGEPLTADGRAVTLGYGANTVNVEVTAQDGTTKKAYTVEITRQLLNAVKIAFPSGSPLQIDFTSANPNTEFEVPAGSDSLDLTVPSGGPELTVVANGSPVTREPVSAAGLKAMAAVALSAPSAWKYAIPLAPGSNEIKLTAVIEGVSKTYTILAIKPAMNVATLKSLSVDGTSLSDFSPDKLEYELNVPNGKTSVGVAAVATVDGATVQGTGPVELSVGANTVTVTVTAKDGVTKKAYKLTINRAAPAASSEARLSGIRIDEEPIASFSPDHYHYSIEVENEKTSVAVAVTKIDSRAAEHVSGNTDLKVGSDNNIVIEVTAQDGVTKKTYTIQVTRLEPSVSNVAKLSALSVTSGELSPAFHPDTAEYAVNVANDVASIGVKPTSEAGGTIKVKDEAVENGQTVNVPLNVGVNPISILVTAQDGVTTKTYTVTVYRAEPSASSDATLSGIKLDGVDIVGFSPEQLTYSYEVPYAKTSIEVAAAAADHNANVSVTGNSGFEVGSGNRIVIEVTAQDGVTKRTYEIVVTRAEQGSVEGHPEWLTGWSAITNTEQPMKLYRIDASNFSAKVDDMASSFDLTMDFDDTVITSVSLRYGEAVITYAPGETKTILFPETASNTTINLEFMKDSSVVGTARLTVLRGEPDPSSYTMDSVVFSRFVMPDYDYFLANPLSDSNEYFIRVQDAADWISAKLLDDGILAISRAGVPISDLSRIELSPGYNAFTVKVSDTSGQFSNTYKLFVYRGDSKVPGLGVTSLTADGEQANWNELLKGYQLFADDTSLRIKPSATAGTTVNVIGHGVADNGDGTYTVPLTEEMAYASIVTSAEGQRWAEPLFIHKNELPAFVTGWTVSDPNDPDNRFKKNMFGDYDGDKQYYVAASDTLAAVKVNLKLEEGVAATAYARGSGEAGEEYSPAIESDGSSTFELNLRTGYNSITFYLEKPLGGEGYDNGEFTLHVVRGEMSLRGIDAYPENGDSLTVTPIGSNSYFAKTESDKVNVYPDSYGSESAIFKFKLNGQPATSYIDLGAQPDGLQDVEITSYEMDGLVKGIYHLKIWKGATGPTGIKVNGWNVKIGDESADTVSPAGILADSVVVPAASTSVSIQPSSTQTIVAVYSEDRMIAASDGRYEIPLDDYDPTTSVQVVLQAADGKRYVYELRIVKETEAKLNSLSVFDSTGPHMLAMDSAPDRETDYVYVIAPMSGEIDVTAIPAGAGTVKIDGQLADSSSHFVTLPVNWSEPKIVPIVVTSISGGQKTYTLKLFPPAPDNEAELVSLVINGANVYPDADRNLIWNFEAGTPEANVNANITLNATNPGATATINGMTISKYISTQLTLTQTVDIPFQVKSADGTTLSDPYTLKFVKVLNSDAGIYNINVLVDNGAYAVVYDDTNGIYKLNGTALDGKVSQVRLLIDTNRSDATLTVNGGPYLTANNNRPRDQLALKGLEAGDNEFDLMVTASDGTTGHYTLMVAREPEFPELEIDGAPALYADGKLWFQPEAPEATEVHLSAFLDGSAALELLADYYEDSGDAIGSDFALPLAPGANTFWLKYTDSEGHSAKKELHIYNRSSSEVQAMTIATAGFEQAPDSSWHAYLSDLGKTAPTTLQVDVAIADNVSVSAYSLTGSSIDAVYSYLDDRTLELPIPDTESSTFIFLVDNNGTKIAYKVVITNMTV